MGAPRYVNVHRFQFALKLYVEVPAVLLWLYLSFYVIYQV